MRRNLTLSLDDTLVKKARVLAAKKHKSISRLVADTLRFLVENTEAYEAAQREALLRLKKGYDLGWKKPRSRAELHER